MAAVNPSQFTTGTADATSGGQAWAARDCPRATRSASRGFSASAGRPGSRASTSRARAVRRSSAGRCRTSQRCTGVLVKVRDLGLCLISVRLLNPDDTGETTSPW